MKKNRILFLLMLITVSFGMTGCQSIEEKKLQAALEKQVPLAETYYEEKYECNIDITSSRYMNGKTADDPNPNTDKMIFYTSENTIIIYDVIENLFSDNKQNREIEDYLENTFISELIAKTGKEFSHEKYIIFHMEYWDVYSLDAPYFSNYYNPGQMETFLLAEKPYILMRPIYIYVEEDISFEEVTKLNTSLSDSFLTYFDNPKLIFIYVTEDFEIDYDDTNPMIRDGYVASYTTDYGEIHYDEDYIYEKDIDEKRKPG